MKYKSELIEKTEKIRNYIKELKIPGLGSDLDSRIQEAYTTDKSYEDLLLEIFQEAYDLRLDNGKKRRIKNANFPYKKYLDNLIVDQLPKDAIKKFKEIKTMNFIDEKRNLILYGNPGTGKSHWALGIGIEACNKGYKVFFTTVASLINELRESRSEKRLRAMESKFEKYDLIICDELGYISFDREGSELLFNFLSLRAERKSTIITTNLSFDRWNEIFKDTILTAALIDRLTHKSYAINMNGSSYRLKETKEWMNKAV